MARESHPHAVSTKYPFLGWKHPIYEAWQAEWEENERRLEGGREVLDELARFDWEQDDATGISPHYEQRKRRAAFLPFPARMAEAFVGALQREAPEPGTALSFGRLGDPLATGTRARLVWQSVDAPAGGAGWNAWWTQVEKNAMATGHRWIIREAPEWPAWAAQHGRTGASAPSLADEMMGFRPYLLELSPLQTPDWHYDGYGILQYLRWETTVRKFEQGKAQNVQRSMLLVRRGCTILGDAFAGGGWWVFEGDEMVTADDGEPLHGTWDDAEIPAFPHFYQRARARQATVTTLTGAKQLSVRPRMSRPGLTEIGQLSVAHMDLGSAAHNDSIEAGSRRIYVVGGTTAGHTATANQLKANSRLVTIPADGQARPTLHDTGAVTASSAITTQQDRVRDQASYVAAEEAAWAPESSGVSKNMGYRDTKSPRLALMASELEASQTRAIHLLERGFGFADPTGAVTWTRDFDLEPLVQDVSQAFELLASAGAQSAELSVHLIMAFLRQKGLVAGKTAQQLETIEGELKESLEQAAANAARSRDIGRSLLERDPLPEDDDTKPEA